MKKLFLAFALLTTTTAGTALADNRGHSVDRRVDPTPAQVRPAPGHRPAWSLISTTRAVARRGTISVALPRTGRYEELMLTPSDQRLDLLAVEISYARGAKQIIRPNRDGTVKLDVDNRRVTSIQVRYANRGAPRGATIKVFGQLDQRIGRR